MLQYEYSAFHYDQNNLFFLCLVMRGSREERGCAVLCSMPHFCVQYVPMNKGWRGGRCSEWLLFSAIPVMVAPLLMLFRWLCDSFVASCDGQLWHCVLWPGLCKQRRRQQTCQLQEKHFQCHVGGGGGGGGGGQVQFPYWSFCPSFPSVLWVWRQK